MWTIVFDQRAREQIRSVLIDLDAAVRRAADPTTAAAALAAWRDFVSFTDKLYDLFTAKSDAAKSLAFDHKPRAYSDAYKLTVSGWVAGFRVDERSKTCTCMFIEKT